MSNMLRKIKRGMRMKNERTTCPKCHAKLIEKYGYVCSQGKRKEDENEKKDTNDK